MGTLTALLGMAVPGASAVDASGRPGPPYRRYVALGDSITAASGAGRLVVNEPGCWQSDRNYPRLVQQALGIPVLVDASCGSATAAHMTTTQHGIWLGVNPPQFSRLTGDTDLVTLLIGGNDIRFWSWYCLALSPLETPCQDHYIVDGRDTLQENVDRTAAALVETVRSIRERAPRADVFVLNYPALLPDEGFGCWPVLPLGWTDVVWLRGIQKSLNAALMEAARVNGAHPVDVYTASIGHDPCAPADTRWIEPIIAENQADPLHPNAAGTAGMAAVVAQAITAAGA